MAPPARDIGRFKVAPGNASQGRKAIRAASGLSHHEKGSKAEAERMAMGKLQAGCADHFGASADRRLAG